MTTSCNHTVIFHTLSTTVMSAPLVINILMMSGLLLVVAICNAVQPFCINKTKKQYIFNKCYKDKYST